MTIRKVLLLVLGLALVALPALAQQVGVPGRSLGAVDRFPLPLRIENADLRDDVVCVA